MCSPLKWKMNHQKDVSHLKNNKHFSNNKKYKNYIEKEEEWKIKSM